MSRINLPPALDFVFILIKSPLQQKLMTGAHPVTVAPLVDINVFYYICLGITFYDLSALVDCWSSFSIRRIIYNFFLFPFDNMAVAVSGKVGIP